MVWFLFSISNGNEVTDDQPVEFSTTAEALDHARAIAAELGTNRKPSDIAGHHVRVKDEAGRELYRTPLVNPKRRVMADDIGKTLGQGSET